jgi:moderate conductance mechanosensitive channel
LRINRLELISIAQSLNPSISKSLLFNLRTFFESVAEFFDVEYAVFVKKAIAVLLIWVGAWVVNRLIRIAARRILKRVDDGDDSTLTLREKRGQTVAQLLRSVGRVMVVVLAILLTLNTFVEITPLLAGAGILGLAISFGAQSLVKDVLSGFFILLENQFAVGDVIEAGGKSGVVERMTMRVVQLRDVEGILHFIPNGTITVVSNKTRGWSRAVVDVGVAYDTDVDRAIQIIKAEGDAFAQEPYWKHRLDGPVEVLGVERLDDNGVILRTLIRTIPGSQWEAGREFRRRIKKRLEQEGIEIPFPQRVMHVRLDSDQFPQFAGAPRQPQPQETRPGGG